MPQILRIGSNDERGFTLIEVIAALLLLTVIVGIVLPEVHRSTRGMETKIALRQIERDLLLAYEESKGTKSPIDVIFSPDVEEYQLIIGDRVLNRPLYGLKYTGDRTAHLVFDAKGSIDGADEVKFEDALGREFIWKAQPLRGQ